MGTGVPLLFSFPIGHQILMIENPVLRPWFEGLARRYELVVFDSRGTGLSQRDVAWTPGSVRARSRSRCRTPSSLTDVFVFAPIGYGHGAIRYALAHPDRVAGLILWASFVNGATALEPTHIRRPRRTELGVLSADDSFIAALARTKPDSCVRGYAPAKQHAAGLPVIHKGVPGIGYRVVAASGPDAYVGPTSQGT